MNNSRRILSLVFCLLIACCLGFQSSHTFARHSLLSRSLTPSHTDELLGSISKIRSLTSQRQQKSSLGAASGYQPPPAEEPRKQKKRPLWPRSGDIVRYYDLDGGKADGQVLVGRISYIQKKLPPEGMDSASIANEDLWLVELEELDDVGDGFYANYQINKRKSKKSMRPAVEVAPIAASYVRAEDAFKVPRDKAGKIMTRAPGYDLDEYPGPFGDAEGQIKINPDVIESDKALYDALKNKLIRYTLIAGAAGSLIAGLAKGPEDGLIYASGSLASVLYLFLLSLKTDTVASPQQKFGNNLSSLRFVSPLFLLAGISLYNISQGDNNPVAGQGIFSRITAEQFGFAIFGFLTYRIPLFFTQIQNAFKDEDGELVLPGSAGIALQLIKDSESSASTLTNDDAIKTVFLVSGPKFTGRSNVVKRFLAEKKDDDRFVEPKFIDSANDGATFERLQQRDEILSMDPSGRYGITKDSILTAASDESSAIVVDADVKLARKMAKIPGIRIVGVWVGLDKVDSFEKRIKAEIDSGAIAIPADESRESVVRGRIREVVQEIEFGISSGLFEFTIINNDEDKSLKELKDAASYCFL